MSSQIFNVPITLDIFEKVINIVISGLGVRIEEAA